MDPDDLSVLFHCSGMHLGVTCYFVLVFIHTHVPSKRLRLLPVSIYVFLCHQKNLAASYSGLHIHDLSFLCEAAEATIRQKLLRLIIRLPTKTIN